MNNSKNLSLHYLALAGVITCGAVLRFWHLDLKPLWLDEVLTAFLSLGHPYKDVPLEVVLPVSMPQLFKLQPDVSWSEITKSVATQSTHPPLFFCLMHQWLNWVEPLAQPLYWKLRALPALCGVLATLAVYCLNRVAFSPSAGLMAAALMAFSPFAVYLSQEARHYTLPMLVITLALLGLIQIQQALYCQRRLPPPPVWLFWGIVNSIGCYIHYFFFFAFIAQFLTLIGLMYWHRSILPRRSFCAVSLVVVGVAMSYLPWLPVLLGSFGRAETGWLPKPKNIIPVFQTLAGWLNMVVALPVEGQPLWIQLPVVLFMIGFGSWVGWQVYKGCKQLWQQPEAYIATVTLLGFILCVLLQFFALIYLLGKDITVAPRYNFVYYPAICALLGTSMVSNQRRKGQLKKTLPNSLVPRLPSSLTPLLIFSLSLLSCIFVIYNLAFLKPFHPEQVARDMNLEPGVPIMMVMGYQNFQDVALGLSFALAIEKLKSDIPKDTASASSVFLKPERWYESVWQKLSNLPVAPGRVNLWIVAPGLKHREYPQQLTLAQRKRCTIDATQYHRIGVPYQLYRCK